MDGEGQAVPAGRFVHRVEDRVAEWDPRRWAHSDLHEPRVSRPVLDLFDREPRVVDRDAQ